MTEARDQSAKGMQALRQKDGRGAEAAFRRAIELGWPGPDVWVTLSFAKSLQGDMAGRIAALEKALEIDPGSVRARLHHGQALVGAGRAKEAEASFRQGLDAVTPELMRNPEIIQLVRAAETVLGVSDSEASPARNETAETLDKFAADHEVGSAPDDDLFRQSLDILSGRAIHYPSRPTRYFYPGLPNRQFYPPKDFAWTGQLAASTADIRDELEALLNKQAAEAAGFTPYVERAGREGASVSHPLLDNPDWSAFYLIKQGTRIEENIARCPKTWAAVEAIGDAVNPAPAPSILFSRLEPGASIPPHHGQFNTRLICHLPVILPGDCGFRVGNETREWRDSEVFIFDDTIEHEAWNRSENPRYVLIFEIWHPALSERQRQLVSDLFKLGGSPAN
ncbi:aspartyl/asparaginyl beta-hydroxylase domain-containing protein [Henriciella marina]|uniref:aspartyl/asparaginyl beta-hydroxylase domain-containing protein n=1 Tax=Henriciella marina TaxID=453851 RepID=UPI000377081A|nr:aspartyl/asparaginyl beta-hydroxylase domain-containing protein [Henriciella marina]